MERNGLKNKNDLISLSLLVGEQAITAEREMYKTEAGKASEAAIRKLSRLLKKAIQNNDFGVLFELERIALERDKSLFGAEDKRSSALAGLAQIYDNFQNSYDIEKTKLYLASTNGNILPKKIPAKDSVQNYIKNAMSQLTVMIGNTSSQAKKNYYVLRKDALKRIRLEYEKNLNIALGKNVEQSRGVER